MNALMAKKLLGRGASVAQAFISENLYVTHNIDATKPSLIRGMVNERCNYKCGYCNCWNMAEYKNEISINDWKKSLNNLKAYIGRFTIQFSGGEPFLKKGFIDLLDHCNEQNITWGVITNGSTFTENTVRRLVSAQPLNIDISVDSHKHSINDFSRGYDGALSKIEYGVNLLRKYRKSSKNSFLIRLKTVVSKSNFLDLPEMVLWAEEMGVDMIDFSPVRSRWNWTEKEKNIIKITTTSEYRKLDKIVDTLIKMKRENNIIETSKEKLLSMSTLFKGNLASSGVAPCRVGMRDYHILPNGEVEVCWRYPTIGNVLNQSAHDIWNSALAKDIRKKTIECPFFGTQKCASSCLDHRTPLQEIKRAMLIIRRRM